MSFGPDHVYIVNESTVLSDAEILAALPAFQRQTFELRDFWGIRIPKLSFQTKAPADGWMVRVIDEDTSVQGALGYHDFTPTGKPISYVFAKTDLENNASWQVTLSHELCEMLVDPYIVAGYQVDNGDWYALEDCDPVEDEGYAYRIPAYPNVLLSDFITPDWFIPGSPGPYDKAGACSAPLEVLPGGYAYVFSGGQWNSLNSKGERAPAEKRDRT